MLNIITLTSTSNPHERKVFQLHSQTPSFNYSIEKFDWILRNKGKPFPPGVHAAVKESPNTLLPDYFSTVLVGADAIQRNVIPHPYLEHDPSYGLDDFLKERVLPTDLSDALRDLKNSSIEAEEDGFEMPSDLAISNAERLLRRMYDISAQRFEVYPTPDAEIAIRALAPRRSVILLCESLGGALCLVNVNSGRRRKRYSSADALPDSFLKEALSDLKGESI